MKLVSTQLGVSRDGSGCSWSFYRFYSFFFFFLFAVVVFFFYPNRHRNVSSHRITVDVKRLNWTHGWRNFHLKLQLSSWSLIIDQSNRHHGTFSCSGHIYFNHKHCSIIIIIISLSVSGPNQHHHRHRQSASSCFIFTRWHHPDTPVSAPPRRPHEIDLTSISCSALPFLQAVTLWPLNSTQITSQLATTTTTLPARLIATEAPGAV